MKEEEKGKEDEGKEKAEKSAGKNETPNAQERRHINQTQTCHTFASGRTNN